MSLFSTEPIKHRLDVMALCSPFRIRMKGNRINSNEKTFTSPKDAHSNSYGLNRGADTLSHVTKSITQSVLYWRMRVNFRDSWKSAACDTQTSLGHRYETSLIVDSVGS